MENKRVKSAIELAMEKVAEMPDLKKEDLQQYKDEEQIAIGEGIAQRFLQGTLRKKNLESELSAYEGEIEQIIRRAALKTLVDAIDIEDMEKNKLIFEAVKLVWKDLPVKQAQTELIQTMGKYKQQREKEIGTSLKKEITRFQSIGIAGSAFLPNLKESPEWAQRQENLQKEYHDKLSKVRDLLQSK